MHDPQDCRTMADLRALIDRLDGELVRLLARRQACIDRAAQIKRQAGMPARIPARIDEVLDNVRGLADATGLDPALAATLWQEMIEWAIAREMQHLAAGGDAGEGRCDGSGSH